MSHEKIIKYSVPFFAFAIISRAIEEISFVYYTVPVLCVFFIVYLFVSSKFKVEQTTDNTHLKSNNHLPSSPPKADFTSFNIIHQPTTLFVIPGLWFLLTAFWSPFPEVSATRALYFILISSGCISAGILWIRFSGKSLLDFLLPVNIFIVLLSLFSFITNIPFDSWTGGHGKGFMGFLGQQNVLASVILFTVPSVIMKFMSLVNRKSSSNYLLPAANYLLTSYSLLLSLNLFILTLTYSRASILSLLFGVVVFLLLSKKWKILSYSFGVAVIFALIIFITPPLKNLTEDIINKDFPEFYSSRIWMWEPSYRAAQEGGLIGLGYGISDPDEKVGGMGDHFEYERFVREKGNSTLALIEETGLIGLILFILSICYIVILSLSKDLNQKTTHYSLLTTNCALLTAALAAFLLHAQFEAWWVGVGSVQLPLFFIYIGVLLSGSKTVNSI